EVGRVAGEVRVSCGVGRGAQAASSREHGRGAARADEAAREAVPVRDGGLGGRLDRQPAPRCDPGRLVHPAILHRRGRCAAGGGHQSRPRARVHLLGEGQPMLYDLRRAALPIRWLVTCLLATLGLSYLFGALMVSLYAGFTPKRVAATYAGPEMSMRMPPETTMVVEHPIKIG